MRGILAWLERGLHHTVWFLSGEFFLTLPRRPNGGSIILFRGTFVSLIVYLTAIGLKSRLEPSSTWTFDWQVLLREVPATLPWLGAIFAGVYTAFYTRFSSQWTYLAGLYNQIKATEVTLDGPDDGRAAIALADWKAGFIEDAEELHLAAKPLFASVIWEWLNDNLVARAYQSNTINGVERLKRIRKLIVQAHERA